MKKIKETKSLQSTRSLPTNTIKLAQLLNPTDLYVEARKRLTELQNQRDEKVRVLSKAPKEKIHVIKSNRCLQFYLRKDSADKSGKYISKSNISLIQTYVQKAYDEKVLRILEKEIDILSKFLQASGMTADESKKSKNIPINKELQQIYSDNPKEMKRYVDPIDLSNEDFVNEWLSQPFHGKEISSELPYYETDRKERVRSKSELNIANALAKHGIPYKYECPVTLRNGRVFYPDFTILDVTKREEIYWEHRGMMDDCEYATHAVSKVKTYVKNGIVLGKIEILNLILLRI